MFIDEHCDLGSINGTYKNNSLEKIDNKEINQCSMPNISPFSSHYFSTTVSPIRTK